MLILLIFCILILFCPQLVTVLIVGNKTSLNIFSNEIYTCWIEREMFSSKVIGLSPCSCCSSFSLHCRPSVTVNLVVKKIVINCYAIVVLIQPPDYLITEDTFKCDCAYLSV